ncbi:MAG TPA: patatin-like phospholipase family protein [Thermoanaerobaculia bacterium]|nr:patatin-like phospholipase family protein [Thermoanaerobaculia bacterium]
MTPETGITAPEFESNRDAVITIQGGGVFGLTLLGQLQAVVEKHRYAPLALAGTSAGAIVAALVWSGMRPSEIRDEFVSMVKEDPDALVSLLGPFPPGFDFDAFCRLKERAAEWVGALDVSSRHRPWNPRHWLGAARMIGGAAGLRRKLQRHVENRGFFSGSQLERKIDELLRRGARIPAGVTNPGELLRFRHFAELMEQKGEDYYRPPLLLTATNLTRQRLEVISSVDAKYMNVPVAKAVRASAGFPVFFLPRELPECPDGGWFVDGGVVSNFPIWAFSDAFRYKVQKSPIYRRLTAKPWIRIGLRVVDDARPLLDLRNSSAYFRSLLSMLTGNARNELEEILSALASRSLVVKQPRSSTAGPELLDIRRLDAAKIEEMVAKGFAFADDYLGERRSPGVYAKPPAALIERELGTLVERILGLLKFEQSAVKLRANVFIPVEDRLKLVFSCNMDDDDDRTMEFPDLESGLTGFCYSSRRPQVCNLASVAALRQNNPGEYRNLFGMDPTLQGRVRQDRSWLATVPIFDPYEVRFVQQRQQLQNNSPHYEGRSYHGVEADTDGAILGILTLDAGWDYDTIGLSPDPDIHFRDPRVEAILVLMQTAAMSLGKLLSEVFPGGGLGS